MPFDFKPIQAQRSLAPGEEPLLPGQGHEEFRDPLGEKARTRSAHNVRYLNRIIAGERPTLDAKKDPQDEFLEQQLQVMNDRDYLLQPVDNYIRKPKSSSDIVIGYHPMPTALVKDQEEIERALGTSGSKKVRVLGTGFSERMNPDFEETLGGREVLIACPGDLYAARELAYLIEKKREQVTEKKKTSVPIAPLIIENRDHFWDNTLIPTKLMKIDGSAPDYDKRQYIDLDALASHYGIYITENREQTLNIARKLAEKNRASVAESPEPIVPEGSVIFVATSTKKKYDEMVNIYKSQGLNVKFRRIEYLLDGSFNSPKEDCFSYEGNAAKKMSAAFGAWDQMSKEEQDKRLEALGLDRNHAFILTEDSGFHFDQPRLAAEKEFKDLPPEIKKDQPFPGTETGPATIGMMGTASFFLKVNDIYDRREQELSQARGREVKLDRIVHQRAVIALAPLAGNDSKHLGKIYMMSAGSDASFTRTPIPATGSIEMDNFLLPLHDNPENQTEAQLGPDWLASYSRRAQAWHALSYEAGIAKDKKHAPDFEKHFTAGIVVDHTHPSMKLAQELAEQGNKGGFRCKVLDAGVRRLRDVQTKILEKADGIVLAFDPEKAREDFWRHMWIVSSLVVGEQTRDKYKLDKPMYLVNPKDESGLGAFNHIEELIHDLHKLGTISQDPTTLLKSVPSAQAAVEGLKEDRKEYHRYDPPAYSKNKAPILEQEGTPTHKPFNVAIFTSVTNENRELIGINKKLTASLIKEGFGIISGAGMNAGMRAIVDTADKLSDRHPELDVHHTGITAPHVKERETNCRPVEDYLDHFVLTRDIYARIEKLLSADAVVITPGGMGTVQELAGFALLKKQAQENPTSKFLQPFKNKELVILNAQVDVEGVKRGFYDELIRVIPPDQLESLGIHMVQNVNQAVRKMKELYQEKMADPAARIKGGRPVIRQPDSENRIGL